MDRSLEGLTDFISNARGHSISERFAFIYATLEARGFSSTSIHADNQRRIIPFNMALDDGKFLVILPHILSPDSSRLHFIYAHFVQQFIW